MDNEKGAYGQMRQKQRAFSRLAAAPGHDQPHRRHDAQHPAQQHQPPNRSPGQQHRQQNSRRGDIMPHGGRQGGLEVVLIFRRPVQLPHGRDDPQAGAGRKNPQGDFQRMVHRQQVFHVHGHAVEQPPQNQCAAAQYDDAYGQAVLFAFLLHNGILHGCKHPAMGAARRPGTSFIIIPVYSPNFQPFVKKLFV